MRNVETITPPAGWATLLFGCGRRAISALALLIGTGLVSAAAAQATSPDTSPSATVAPPYESQLLRLSQVLGSVTYLRQLCKMDVNDDWRATMQSLLDTEAAGEPERAKQLTAAFNRGYRSFASVYVTCTDSALAAEEDYRHEGATLARKIAAKYGN